MNSKSSEDLGYQTTPNRSDGCRAGFTRKRTFDRSILPPYKCLELNSTAIAPGSIIDKMPIYTPPKIGNSQIVRNPFEQAWLLKEKLSQPVCSPSLFQKVISPINKTNTFSWSIDEISVLRPAQIDENPSQEFTSWFSPDTESQVQDAIDRFFTSTSQGTLESPMPVIEAPKSQDVSCQTKLSFPPFLPETIEAELEALSMRLTGGSAAEAMDESLNTLNSSNCSARRKILSVEVEPPSDELQSDSSDENESMKPMYAATPIRKMPESSPDCSPIYNGQDMSISMVDFSQSPSR